MAKLKRQRKQLHASGLVVKIFLILALLARIAVEVVAYLFPQSIPIYVAMISNISIYALWTLSMFISIIK